MTSMASPKSTSSPGSAGGRTPPASPDGPMTDLFGQALAPASRSRSRAKGPDLLMQGICGPTFTDSSVPDGPLSLWESRLRERLAMVGSTESPLIWRLKTTPAGMSISRLAPWTPPTSVSEATGSLWPTPKAANAGPDFAKIERSKTGLSLQTMQALTLWPTPKASAAGETSRSGDRKDEPLMGGLMRRLAETELSGQTPNGSLATTAKRGAPNPAFPCWLMGYPAEWLLGAVSATQSIRSSRRK